MLSKLLTAWFACSHRLSHSQNSRLTEARNVQASFGRGWLATSSFLTYVGLGLGFLGSSLALPFGLYVLIVQRQSEVIQLLPTKARVAGNTDGYWCLLFVYPRRW